MRILRAVTLHNQQGRSDKVYEVDLCELDKSGLDRFVVNFRYGRRGGNLREGSKTPEAAERGDAEAIFDSASRLN
jgi:cellulose synthase operon protein C